MNKLIGLFLLLLLVGCATDPVVSYKTLVVAPNDSLLVNAYIPPPPSKDEYMAASPRDREGLLVKHSMQLMKSLEAVNIRFKELREWKLKSLEAVEKTSNN